MNRPMEEAVVSKVSIINFKGGVGKTTLAFHLATFLARRSRVLAVDVDHQSSLSLILLGKHWEQVSRDGHTCNRIFQSFVSPKKVRMPGREVIFSNPMHTRHPRYDQYPSLDLVPAQFELDDTEIDLASTTVGSPAVSEWEKRTLLATWLDEIDAASHYDYVIFDCPPATKLVSQNALAASDCFVTPVIPDELSSRGVTHFRHLVEEKIDKKLEFLRKSAGIADAETPRSYVSQTRMVGIAIFMAKTAGNAASGLTDLHTMQIRRLRRQWGEDMLDAVVKHLTGVPESVNTGWPVWDRYGDRNVSTQVVKMMSSLCEEIRDRIEGISHGTSAASGTGTHSRTRSQS